MNIYNYSVFPSILSEIDCDLYQYIRNPLIDWIFDYQNKTKSVIYSNRGGWQSPSDFYKQECFLEFKNYILNNTFAALRHYNRDFNLANMWININKKGNYNISHNHANSIISGVFWVKTPDNCGHLVFESPNSFLEHNLLQCIDEKIKEEHNYHHTFQFVPQEGKLVLFPSHLRHYVESNESDEDRISIAFNLNT